MEFLAFFFLPFFKACDLAFFMLLDAFLQSEENVFFNFDTEKKPLITIPVSLFLFKLDFVKFSDPINAFFPAIILACI